MPKENHTVGQRARQSTLQTPTAQRAADSSTTPPTRSIKRQQYRRPPCPNISPGVGLFTTENIVAVLRAIPESDVTYRDVARKAEQYGGNCHYHTISNWVSHGRADVVAGQPSTAYARFTKRYQNSSTSTADRIPTEAANSTEHSRS